MQVYDTEKYSWIRMVVIKQCIIENTALGSDTIK